MHTKSLWLANPSDSYPPAGNLDVDVAVLGGGIAGLTTATLLAMEGADVALFEARRIGTGTTGHTTGKVTALQGAIYQKLERSFGREGAQTYAAATVAAMKLTLRLADQLSIECNLERRPTYTYAEDGANLPTIRSEVEAATRAGLPAEFVSDTELPFPVAGAVRLDDQIQYDSFRFCHGLARGIVKHGGRVFEQSQAVDVDDQGDHFEIRLGNGALVNARRVVVATLLPFLDRGAFFSKTRPSQTYLSAFESGASGGLRGMYLSVDDPTRTLRQAGGFILVGGETHRVGEQSDTQSCYAAIADWARERFGLGEPAFRWSSHDYVPLDDIPYVGRMPRSRDELVLATGFRKWGLTNGPIAAMVISDAFAGRDNDWSEFFSATRIDAMNSAADFVKDNVEVAKHFVGDRLRSADERSLDALAPGEGGIVEVAGDKVAAYRNVEGDVVELSPKCPHMGCELVWNTAEKTWDCPCHGSRFECDGAYIAGPATAGMTEME